LAGSSRNGGIDKKKESDEYLKKSDDVSLKKGQECWTRPTGISRWPRTYIFGWQERYPTHPLAGWAGLRGGQNRMRYGDNAGAIEIFERVYLNGDYDGPDVRAQAMYWPDWLTEKLMLPATHPRGRLPPSTATKMAAIALYEVCRFSSRASEWAKHARGRLPLAVPVHATIQREENRPRNDALAALQARNAERKVIRGIVPG